MARTRLTALSELLQRHLTLWLPLPLIDPLTWPQRHPELERWLLALTEAQLRALELDARAPDAPQPYAALSAQVAALCEVPALPRIEQPALARRARRIKARKWSQVQAFAGTALPLLPDGGLVDWCAGKGHLGRSLALVSGRGALCIERDAALCEGGAALAGALPVSFLNGDVLALPLDELLTPGRSAVALHACGQLGDTLLREGGALDAIAFAPCCYHRQPPGPHRPLSELGRATALPVSVRQLRLATAEEVHATDDQRALRHQEVAWRFGLDALVREATGRVEHTSIPSMPRSQVRVSFSEFVTRAAERHGLTLPERWDPAAAEQVGWRRAHRKRALDLMRSLFRPALELWLFLDRVVYLEERGWEVRWGSFCERAVSARNLMMIGARPGAGVSEPPAG